MDVDMETTHSSIIYRTEHRPIIHLHLQVFFPSSIQSGVMDNLQLIHVESLYSCLYTLIGTTGFSDSIRPTTDDFIIICHRKPPSAKGCVGYCELWVRLLSAEARWTDTLSQDECVSADPTHWRHTKERVIALGNISTQTSQSRQTATPVPKLAHKSILTFSEPCYFIL